MKIAIVNQSDHTIKSIRTALPTQYSVVWTAIDRSEAISKCVDVLPDVLLIDAQIVTQQLINQAMHVLLITPTTKQNIAKIYTAIEQGAADVVDPANSSDLLAKLARLSRRTVPGISIRRTVSSTLPLVAIGSSTGGPKALATILAKLPANFGAAIAIVQHVDAHFSSGFADWLSQQTALPVRIAAAGDRLEKSSILIAGTNDHLYVKPDLTLDYTAEPLNYAYRPSVDVFFQSLAQHWQRPATAVLLTGMGCDGAVGLSALKQRGWCTIAQNSSSCAVYGMPKAAVELNATTKILSPEEIAKTLLNLKG